MTFLIRLLLMVALVAPHTASACSVCFGNSDSPWRNALDMGVLALLGVVILVIGGIVAFFIHTARRARVLAQLTTQEKLQP